MLFQLYTRSGDLQVRTDTYANNILVQNWRTRCGNCGLQRCHSEIQVQELLGFGASGYGFLPYDYVSGSAPDTSGTKLVSDCWTIDSIEYESDAVILRGEGTPERVDHFEIGIVNPDAPRSDD